MAHDISFFERQIARLIVVLYHCGRPINSLIDGEIRQIDSIGDLQRFDFWVREPGHLALALLALSDTPDSERKAALDRMMDSDQADTRRVGLAGAPYTFLEDFDSSLSFLTSRALVSDRPSFVRSRSYGHQIILESAGVEIARKILADCPTFAWYRQQSETVSAYFPALEKIDLNVMPYLEPDLSPRMATSTPLSPLIRARYLKLFGEAVHALNADV